MLGCTGTARMFCRRIKVPAPAVLHSSAPRPTPAGHRSASGKSGDKDPIHAREARIAKMCLKEYMKAKDRGDAQEALRFLAKANEIGRFVHLKIPQFDGGVPLAAILPSWEFNSETRPRSVLPVSIGKQKKKDKISSRQASSSPAYPVPLMVPFGRS
mmetsp:Transcript_42399/g.76116  ORF Transcript_42399/g.76116 Transcript_42399/m.76116 type:complete len:157 (-) Transcript_42399:151-621(-)